MREFSLLAILLGVVIGALLAAASAFVGLQVGMTVSASIPAAVMALLILRTLLKRGTLLETNMVQTVGSAGETVAAGMIFTIPALFIMGEDPAYLEMIIWGGIGGLLGVCFMVPLRRVLIVKEHGVLPYPEGVACAEVLQSGERGGQGARPVIWGAVVGGVYYLINQLGFWEDTAVAPIKRFRTEAQLDSYPALLGVGYILGPRIAAYMLSGAVLSWFVLIPGIAFFGADSQTPVFPSETMLIAEMEPDGDNGLWGQYIRFIGAGAVAIGGLIALFKSFPTILSSFWHVLAGVLRSGRGSRDRTEKDFPFVLLLLIIAGLAYALWHFKQVAQDQTGIIAIIAIIVFTFFFVTVSSRLVGIVGSSSNPVSGMTIATLLATALVYKFFVVDQAGEIAETDLTALKISCLSVGAIVCIAISVAGDTSQDLKTGFLVKATPYKQQTGEMIGVITSVVVIAALLLLLSRTYGFGEVSPEFPKPLLAPQANIMKILVEGVLGDSVPWTLIMIGGAAAVIVEMLGLPALPFAVGMYLPLGLSTPIMAGGIIRWAIDRRRKEQTEHDPGVLGASGLVAGQGLIGVALAGAAALIAWLWKDPWWVNPVDGEEVRVLPAHLVPWMWDKIDALPMHWGLTEAWWDVLPFFPFLLLVLWLWWCARRRPRVSLPPAGTVTAGPPKPIVPTTPEPPSPPPAPEGEDAAKAPGVTPPQPGPIERDLPPRDDAGPAGDTPLIVEDEGADDAAAKPPVIKPRDDDDEARPFPSGTPYS
jgi:putative OPT family oligopeptide transporter